MGMIINKVVKAPRQNADFLNIIQVQNVLYKTLIKLINSTYIKLVGC